MAEIKDLDKERAAIKILVLETNALNASEKKYWKSLLPNMNESQLAQLRSILEKEQKSLQKIDDKYDRKLEGVAQKYLSQWDSEKFKNARVKRKVKEKAHQEEAHKEAEELLKGW